MRHGPMLFDFLSRFTETAEGKVLYILALVCILMIIDFLLGSLAAWRNTSIKFSSQTGINGILRKLASMIVLVVCIPLSVLVPAGAGVAALYVLYSGYLILEFISIVENLDKLGVEVSYLRNFIENFKDGESDD